MTKIGNSQEGIGNRLVGVRNRGYWLLAIGYWLFLFSPLAAYAAVEVLFSPRDNIHYRIIEAINLSEDRIDVAAFDFSSREIADALVNAKSKGLVVRLLVDKKLLEVGKDSQAKYLEEKGFNIKALKGKGEGSMKNSFAIFDGKLVIVGPYHLAEEKESYDYENAIFFDDPAIVETYQNEFDKLFGKRSTLTATTKKSKESLLSTVIKPSSNLRQEPESQEPVEPAPKPIIEAGTIHEPPLHSETKTVVSEKPSTTITTTTSPPTTTQVEPQATPMVEPTSPQGSLVDIAFEELDKIFGKESTLSEAEKSALWPKYMGRYVKWTGEVTYTLLGLVKGTRIGFRHKQGTDTDVEVRFSIKKATKIMKIAQGDTITYTAKLFTYPTTAEPYYVLTEGALE